MSFDYVLIVALAGILYAAAARGLQQVLINQEEVKAIQAESKQLSEDLKKAKEANDQARMEELMKKQMQFLPKMNKMMFAQFKPMIFIIVIFMATTWYLEDNDPFKHDDIMLNLTDDGKGCDAKAGDSMFTTCYSLAGKKAGVWVASARAMNNGNELGINATTFLYNEHHPFDRWTKAPGGEPVSISTDKDLYLEGENATITVYAPPKANRVELTLDMGTEFNVDLPFVIPVLNVQRFHDTQGWFLFVAIIAGIVMSLAIGQYQKMKVKK